MVEERKHKQAHMDQFERVRLPSARERARKGGTGGINDDCLAAAHFMINNQMTLSKCQWRTMEVDLLLDVSAKLAPLNSETRAADTRMTPQNMHDS